MNAEPVRIWWHCASEAEKQTRIDILCQRAHSLHKTVAALSATGQLISNLTVRENIELVRAWECREAPISSTTLRCLQRGFTDTTPVEEILSRQGARLSANERRWVALARAIHNDAQWIVVEDDETSAWPFNEERLLAILHYFPAATLHWVSLGQPDTLPAGWSRGDQGENR